LDALLIVGISIVAFLVVAAIVLAVTGYTVAEAAKFIVALAFLAGSAAALFVSGYDPNFTQAIATLAGAVYAVIGVFAATNHTPGDIQKALEALKGAIVSVVGFFATVPAGTDTQIAVLIAAFVGAYAVYQAGNAPRPEALNA